MRLKLVRNAKPKKDNPYLFRFVDMIAKYAHNHTRPEHGPHNQQVDLSENDYVSMENSLHIDFLKSVRVDYNENSDQIQMVIFIDKDSVFSENSIPLMIFSLDLLIEEKIEMLDAGVIDEISIAMLQRLAVRLNNDKNLLQEALKRHYSKQNHAENKNSPLW